MDMLVLLVFLLLVIWLVLKLCSVSMGRKR